MLVKETQTDVVKENDHQYELQVKDGYSTESQQNSCMQKYMHYTLQCQSPKSSMNLSNASSLTNARCDQPTTQLQHCQIRRPIVTLQHQRVQPLSNLLPSERMICFSEVNSSSPVAAVSPIVNGVTIKQENTPSNDNINNNIIRRPKRRNQTERKDDHSEIFMFDICSDLNDSQEMLQVEDPKEKQPTNETYQAKVKKTSIHTASNEQIIKENIRCDWPSTKARNTAVQKDITSYGKIKKHSVGNWAKKTPWKSPNCSMSVSKITPKSKTNTRLTSRESIAQKRKEYAESVFCFDDYADLKQIQLQFKSSSSQKLHSR
ncbi:uncharacterized protein LOC135692610 [Rhopilema esculentum]|uniref:uncharacterized protein LOC135692610 n=1 Tax=Rhopilema esculentum TaxID=499914 RepID=UPI0031CE949E